ncbi:hypothetical protein, partial [Fluviicola sp.]|uniref:hypothetical protein n=1 Tax=Fluviicola sp. TaxID=1917219 RepID=UPI00262AA729
VPKKKFDASFPGTTITRRQIIQGSKGPEYLVTESFEPSSLSKIDKFGNTAYCVNYIDFQREPMNQMSADLKKKFLHDSSLKNPVIQNGGEVLSIKESTIDGFPCSEMRALILGGQLEFYSKTFFRDNYLYQVIVLSLPKKSNNEASKKFMESFHHHK